MSKQITIETDRIKTVLNVADDEASFTASYCQKDRKLSGCYIGECSPEDFASKGGTSLYCPSCRGIRKCAASDPSFLKHKSGQRFYHKKQSDIHWFRRARQCRTCFYNFTTAEVEEAFVDELVRLRNDIAKGKKVTIENVGEYAPNVISFPSK